MQNLREILQITEFIQRFWCSANIFLGVHVHSPATLFYAHLDWFCISRIPFTFFIVLIVEGVMNITVTCKANHPKLCSLNDNTITFSWVSQRKVTSSYTGLRFLGQIRLTLTAKNKNSRISSHTIFFIRKHLSHFT